MLTMEWCRKDPLQHVRLRQPRGMPPRKLGETRSPKPATFSPDGVSRPVSEHRMKYSNDKDIARLVRRLVRESAGWYFLKGKRHGKLVAPNGKKIPVPCTPSDRRAFDNFKWSVRHVYYEAVQI